MNRGCQVLAHHTIYGSVRALRALAGNGGKETGLLCYLISISTVGLLDVVRDIARQRDPLRMSSTKDESVFVLVRCC